MLTAAVFFPMIAGALIPLFRFRRSSTRGVYTMAVASLTTLLVLFSIFQPDSPRETLFYLADHLPIAFSLDSAGKVFACIVAVLWPLTTLYALEYMNDDTRQDSFFSFFTMCFGITLGIAAASDLLTLYIFYELLTLGTLPLVTHGGSSQSISAGLKYLYYSIGGAAFAFIGLVFVIFYGGTSRFAYGGLMMLGAGAGQTSLQLGYLLCFLGFGVKAAVFPMHAWLPAASVAPTPVTALLHAVAVVKAGVFAIIRITWYSFGPDLIRGTYAQHIPLILVILTIVYGCSMALKEQHIKRRLAYSTVSNLSYVLFGVLLLTPEGLHGGLQHLVFHALMKITLFLAAGIYLKREKLYIQDLRGIHRTLPLTTGVFTIGAIAMTGIPPLIGFVSKFALASAAAQLGGMLPVAGIVALLISAVLTAIYLITPSVTAYTVKLPAPADQQKNDPDWKAGAVLALLGIVMIVISLWPSPLLDYLHRTASGLI